MEYKGYTGIIEVDESSDVLYGRVLGLRDVVTFQGETVAAARQAFQDSVDEYLAFCAERGEPPEKPYSGKFVLRISPALHRSLAMQADTLGQSLNTYISAVLARQASEAAREGARAAISGSVESTQSAARRASTDDVTDHGGRAPARGRQTQKARSPKNGSGTK